MSGDDGQRKSDENRNKHGRNASGAVVVLVACY